jgi:hypothetical protein
VPRDQRAGALRSAELVRRYRDKVRAARCKVERKPAGDLHRVGMEKSVGGVHARCDFLQRLQYAGFVVGGHDRYKRPAARGIVASEHGFECDDVDDAVLVDRDLLDPVGGEAPAGADGRMFDAGDDQRVAVQRPSGDLDLRRERKRDRFRGAAGEGHGARRGSDEGGDLGAGFFDQGAGEAALGMHRGRVCGLKRACERFPRRGAQGRSCVMVEIDPRHRPVSACKTPKKVAFRAQDRLLDLPHGTARVWRRWAASKFRMILKT